MKILKYIFVIVQPIMLAVGWNKYFNNTLHRNQIVYSS